MSSFIALRADYGPIALVPRPVMNRMRRYQMPTEANREAGGIFIGNFRDRHIEVTACTEPQSGDKRDRYSFDRLDPAHAEAATRHWRNSDGTETFVGEWHTHPEAHPSPSIIDLSTWKAALDKYQPMPLLFSICGMTETAFWLGASGRFVKLIIVQL